MMHNSPPRHPELVSGSIARPTPAQRRQAQASRKVMPVHILALDEVDLPSPMPALQLLLARDGGGHVGEHLKADEGVDVVAACEAGTGPFAMLPEPCGEVAGNANVERAMGFAGEDVDAGVAFELHGAETAATWMLKQVQHDGIAEFS